MRTSFYTLLTAVLLIFSQAPAHGAGTPGTLKWFYATGSAILLRSRHRSRRYHLRGVTGP